jgi:hypothetical protein
MAARLLAVGARHSLTRPLGLIDPEQFESAFRRWTNSISARSGRGDRSHRRQDQPPFGGIDATALYLVSAFAAGAGLVLGQRATTEKSNEITAIPELLSTLSLTGCTVPIDAMSTQTAIADAIQQRGADYVLAFKDNHPKLAESIQDFLRSFRAIRLCTLPINLPSSRAPLTSRGSRRRALTGGR